jgi:hypothetical protein
MLFQVKATQASQRWRQPQIVTPKAIEQGQLQTRVSAAKAHENGTKTDNFL